MARIGRPPLGSKIVESLEASDEARERLRAVLDSVDGTPIAELCARLGVERAYFNRLRTDALQAAADRLEARTPGPKPKQPERDERDQELELLRTRVRELELQLEATRLRAELGITLPGVLKKKRR